MNIKEHLIGNGKKLSERTNRYVVALSAIKIELQVCSMPLLKVVRLTAGTICLFLRVFGSTVDGPIDHLLLFSVDSRPPFQSLIEASHVLKVLQQERNSIALLSRC